VASLKKVLKSHQPDLLFAEPSSMVVTRELRDATTMGLRDVSYNIGPFITLVDGPGFESNWLGRKELLMGQITGADIVALSRADLLDEDEIRHAQGVLEEYAHGVVRLSVRKGWALSEVVDRIVGNESSRAALV